MTNEICANCGHKHPRKIGDTKKGLNFENKIINVCGNGCPCKKFISQDNLRKIKEAIKIHREVTVKNHSPTSKLKEVDVIRPVNSQTKNVASGRDDGHPDASNSSPTKDLSSQINERLSFHFDEIQKILGEKEKGKVDINLDVLFKIHNNCLEELRKVNRFNKEFLRLVEEDIKRLEDLEDIPIDYKLGLKRAREILRKRAGAELAGGNAK